MLPRFPRTFWMLASAIAVIFLVYNIHNILQHLSDHQRRDFDIELQSVEDFRQIPGELWLSGRRPPQSARWLFRRGVYSQTASVAKKTRAEGPDANLNVNDTESLKREVERINKEQFVRNLPKLGLTLSLDSVVVVVQVHNRVQHMGFLVESLRKVRGIEQALLIVSHDVYSHELNALVRNITFCPVLQIFFPYSMQIYHDRFPSQGPDDCGSGFTLREALSRKCKNALYFDKHGHYRTASLCQSKHHWIWKLQFVFEQVRLLKGYKGDVLFLEDDNYVTQDILFVLSQMQRAKNRDCPHCRMLMLGGLSRVLPIHYALSGSAEASHFTPNMGMAFSAALWQEIKKCGQVFCYYDDYNWDLTLRYVSIECIPRTVIVLNIVATRVFHTGQCDGMHVPKNKTGMVCDLKATVEYMQQVLRDNEQGLFPDTIVTKTVHALPRKTDYSNGGWSDPRDHRLCMSFINNSVEPFVKW